MAALIRRALEHISPERLVIASDCGMGREGMSRRHAFHKMVSIVQGTNIVRRELGLPEAVCLAADDRFSLVEIPDFVLPAGSWGILWVLGTVGKSGPGCLLRHMRASNSVHMYSILCCSAIMCNGA